MTAAYKLELTDGFVYMIDDEGYTYVYYLEQILDIIENDTTANVDDIELIDNRKPLPEFDDSVYDIPPDLNKEETGFSFREEQIDGISLGLNNLRGVLEFATNLGKTSVCLGYSKKLDGILKTVIIIPSEQLASQTFEDYKKSSLNCAYINKKIKPAKRPEAIEKADHIIITTKLFMNCVEMFDFSKCALFIDECHIFGEVFADKLRFDAPMAPMAIGLTGTLPKDKLKRNKICATIGGGVIGKVSTHETIKKGYSSKAHIKLVDVIHPEIEDLFDTMIEKKTYDWSLEQNYYNTNEDRMKAIAEYIQSLPKKNTLILCHAQFGNMMCDYLGEKFIYDEISVDERKELFAEFKTRDDLFRYASFGTSSTGISENNILRLVLIELGTDEKLLIQSIGRAIRKDGVVNEVDVIDIGSKTKYAERHRKNRIKVYKSEKHPVDSITDKIEVKT